MKKHSGIFGENGNIVDLPVICLMIAIICVIGFGAFQDARKKIRVRHYLHDNFETVRDEADLLYKKNRSFPELEDFSSISTPSLYEKTDQGIRLSFQDLVPALEGKAIEFYAVSAKEKIVWQCRLHGFADKTEASYFNSTCPVGYAALPEQPFTKKVWNFAATVGWWTFLGVCGGYIIYFFLVFVVWRNER